MTSPTCEGVELSVVNASPRRTSFRIALCQCRGAPSACLRKHPPKFAHSLSTLRSGVRDRTDICGASLVHIRRAFTSQEVFSSQTLSAVAMLPPIETVIRWNEVEAALFDEMVAKKVEEATQMFCDECVLMLDQLTTDLISEFAQSHLAFKKRKLQTNLARSRFEQLWPKKAAKIRKVVARDSKRVANQLCDSFIKKLFYDNPPETQLITSALAGVASNEGSVPPEIGMDNGAPWSPWVTSDTNETPGQPSNAMHKTTLDKHSNNKDERDGLSSKGISKELMIKSGEFGCCNICLEEEPVNPVGCIYCKQLVGCRSCASRWFYSGGHGRTPWAFLDPTRAWTASNNERCPLCRHEWEEYPEVLNMLYLKDN